MDGRSYVVAVSGGVDSVALLHMLAVDHLALYPDRALSSASYTLHVAHYDHGIRPDSGQDCQLVQKLAMQYGLAFIFEHGKLGPGASEAAARTARYDFLQRVCKQTGSDAIITAHHQDDVLETMVINLLRGTSNRGLHSLRSTDSIRRPLLAWPKQQVRAYAQARTLEWHEDSTNANPKYLSNYIRHQILPRFDNNARQQLLAHNMRAAILRDAIDALTARYLRIQPGHNQLDRPTFTLLPHVVAREVLAAWLRQGTTVPVHRCMLERLVTAIKTGRSGSTVPVARGYMLRVDPTTVTLFNPGRIQHIVNPTPTQAPPVTPLGISER